MNRYIVTEKSFYKTLLVLCIPIALQQLITAGVNMMDTIMLGQLDETALSAASMATQVHLLFTYISLGVGTGSAVFFARYWGAGDHVSLRTAVTVSLRMILLLSAVYTLAVGLFPEGTMRILTNDPVIIREGVRYLNWSVPCYVLMGLTTVCTCILRNIRKANLPLYTSILAFFVNVFFNWVFIFGHLGAPQMGVAGAALGTLIARVVETGIIVIYLFCADRQLSYRLKDLFLPCPGLLREYLKVTIPTIFSDLLLGLGNSMTAAIGGRISQAFMAGYSIVSVVLNVVLVFSSSLGQGAQIIIGNTLGEGRREDVRPQSNTILLLSTGIGIVLSILIVILAPTVVAGYHLSEESGVVAMQLLYGQAVICTFMVLASVLTKGILRGGGDTRFLMVADILFLWCCSVPLGYLTGVVLGWSAFTVFLFLRIDHALKVVLCLVRFRTDKWIKRIRSAA